MTDGSFGNIFADWCIKPIFGGIPTHGLHKPTEPALRTDGAFYQLMAILGRDTLKAAERQISKADRVPESAIHLLDVHRSQ